MRVNTRMSSVKVGLYFSSALLFREKDSEKASVSERCEVMTIDDKDNVEIRYSFYRLTCIEISLFLYLKIVKLIF